MSLAINHDSTKSATNGIIDFNFRYKNDSSIL